MGNAATSAATYYIETGIKYKSWASKAVLQTFNDFYKWLISNWINFNKQKSKRDFTVPMGNRMMSVTVKRASVKCKSGLVTENVTLKWIMAQFWQIAFVNLLAGV